MKKTVKKIKRGKREFEEFDLMFAASRDENFPLQSTASNIYILTSFVLNCKIETGSTGTFYATPPVLFSLSSRVESRYH